MNKYVFVYYGKMRAEDIKPEDKDAIMQKWGAWFETFKDQMVDGGNPFADGAMAVTKDGAEEIPADMWPSKGYTIINADSMEAAVKIAEGCPVIADDPEGSVRVYQAIPM